MFPIRNPVLLIESSQSSKSFVGDNGKKKSPYFWKSRKAQPDRDDDRRIFVVMTCLSST